MATEIERKYLVKDEFKHYSKQSFLIKQGYLSRIPERTVRIRIIGRKGYITIKGKSNKIGTTRYEFEKEISLEEAQSLIELCEEGIIEKTRYIIEYKNNTFEVDEFHGSNSGLILAEIELEKEDDAFEKPNWLGTEVTGDKQYYNSILSKQSSSK